MGECKTEAIQLDQLDFWIFAYIKAYSGIIQAYAETCVTLTYSELWYNQKAGIFRTRGIIITLVYSEPWHIQNTVKRLRWTVLQK